MNSHDRGGKNSDWGVRTKAVHGGETPDPATGASAPNIVMSSTYVVDEPSGFSAHDITENSPHVYSRWSNPTVRMLENKISILENTEASACFASGMAAAAAIFMSELSCGDRLVVSDVSYAGVAELVRETLPRFGVEVVTVDMSDLDMVRQAIKPGTRLVHVETPANPIIRLTDLAAISAIAHEHGARVSCDSTFATPLITRPGEFGVDYIMHSLTKYIGGHGDALGGAVSGRKDLIRALNSEAAIHYGGVLSRFNAWLIARGCATLPLRMKAHGETAQRVAEWLEGKADVARVIFPGLASHPQYELAQRQMNGPSAMIAFQVGDRATGERVAKRMMSELEVIHYAVSLGHHRSLIFWMGTDELLSSSFKLTDAGARSYRDFAGDGIFRLSVGLEDSEDLINDLGNVLG
jgi:methionine-gamma-lyase